MAKLPLCAPRAHSAVASPEPSRHAWVPLRAALCSEALCSEAPRSAVEAEAAMLLPLVLPPAGAVLPFVKASTASYSCQICAAICQLFNGQ